MSHTQNNVTKFRYQTKCKIHEVYIITDYLENKAISDLLNDVCKYQNYALYVTEWKMSKNIKTMKNSVWLMNLSKTARIPQYLFFKKMF